MIIQILSILYHFLSKLFFSISNDDAFTFKLDFSSFFYYFSEDFFSFY